MGPTVLAVVSMPSRDQELQLELVARHLPEGMLDVISFEQAPLGPGITFEHKSSFSRTLVDGRPLDPAVIWWSPGLRQAREEALKQVLLGLLDAESAEQWLGWASAAVTEHVTSLVDQFPDALLVNDPVKAACSRPKQLRFASKVGFQVPDTLQSSDPDYAPPWVAAQLRAGECVFKSPTRAVFKTPDGEHQMMLFTTEILPGMQPGYASIRITPTIFQQGIDGDDVRVVVVGRRAFAGRVVPLDPPPAGTRDYRASDYTFELHRLPDEVEMMCVELVRKLGLVHGEIDLILDSSGAYWFLEVNTDGMWAAIEIATGQPIGEAFAALFRRALRRWSRKRTPRNWVTLQLEDHHTLKRDPLIMWFVEYPDGSWRDVAIISE
jgi:hypothetical protein